MDIQTIFFSTYEVILSLVFGLLTIYVCIKILNKTFLRSHRGNLLLQSNTAASIFAGMMILSVLILVHGSVLPSVDALRTMALGRNQLSFYIVLLSLGYFIWFYVIALVISIVIIFLTTQIYLVATINIDEMGEIRKNNIAVAILISAVLLGMTFFIRPATQRFIASLVNYEELEKVDVGMQPESGKEDEGMVVPERTVSPKQ